MLVLLSACSTENSETVAPENESVSSEATAINSDSDAENALRIVYLGDSITAGYGLSEEQAFPALISDRLEENGFVVQGINAGISGDTSTGGLNRIDWLLKQRIDVLLLELGGNDGLRGIDLALTRANLDGILTKTKEAWPEVRLLVAGMMIPPNLGHVYTREFEEMYPKLADKHNATFIQFTPEGLPDILQHMQADQIHPTEEGHRIIAAALYPTIEQLVGALTN